MKITTWQQQKPIRGYRIAQVGQDSYFSYQAAARNEDIHSFYNGELFHVYVYLFIICTYVLLFFICRTFSQNGRFPDQIGLSFKQARLFLKSNEHFPNQKGENKELFWVKLEILGDH